MTRKDRIEIDFARAISQAQELEDISGELSMMAKNHVADALKMLSICWSGDNAAEFLKRGETIVPDLYETAEELVHTAKNIRYTAEIIYRAELNAINCVENRQLSYR